MSDRADVSRAADPVIYVYDGSFEGFLCCVYASYYRREIPMQILCEEPPPSFLYRVSRIETEGDKADRVLASIPRKISAAAENDIRLCFLSGRPDKERIMLDYLRLGYRIGPRVTRLLQDQRVDALRRAVEHVTREAHLLKGFVRFADYGGVLAAVIGPKNFALPLLAGHFAERLPEERFLIYDENHHAALFYRPHEMRIVPMESFTPPAAGEEETAYQALWQRFYDTIAIEGRENPRCRMSMMPKRYWKYMTEFAPPANASRGIGGRERTPGLTESGPEKA